ncbi:MAG: hypothetical protein GC159_10280 [Phycisphaera sp.]|nr:hypothetical protein [Phycisphaera sp.]
MSYLVLATSLFDTSDFPERWHCGHWTEFHGWTHIISDLATFGAYTAIPCVLAYFIIKRRDIPFPRIFWLFCAFIFACGTVHLIEAVIFWWPVYRLSALVKAITAIVSWATVLAMIPIIPTALSLPGLAKINERLEDEIAERARTEEALQQRADALEKLTSELERFSRVAVGREQRIVDLKREVNAMAAELGRAAPYTISEGFEDDHQTDDS